MSNIFEEQELQEDSVVSILETTAADGKKVQDSFYHITGIHTVISVFPRMAQT